MTFDIEPIWLAIGFAGQALFSARFIVQWIASERAKRSLAQLDSGVRMRTTNAQGESVYMEEKDIAAERARVQAVVNADCAP